MKNEPVLTGTSLYLFGPKNAFRITLAKFINNPYFEETIMYLIGLNSILLMIGEPGLKDCYSRLTLTTMNDTISFIYLGECALKIITHGFVIGKNTYLKEYFNIFDFMIVGVSLINYIFIHMDVQWISLSAVKAFRALRALRPLKLISKDKGMRLVVNSLLKSIPNLFNVLMILFLFLCVFAILAVQILSGKMSHCDKSEAILLTENMCIAFGQTWNETCSMASVPIKNKGDCINACGNWILPKNNYNNVGAALNTFFEISTLEMWPDIMFAAVDSASKVDGIPEKNSKPMMQLLFICFVFFTTFFALGLFLNVMVDKFHEESEKNKTDDGISDEKKAWIRIQSLMLKANPLLTPVEPKSGFRKWVFRLVTNKYFEWTIIILIVLNGVVLLSEVANASKAYVSTLWYLNMIAAVIFLLECILKIIGFGPTQFLKIPQCLFDLTIVLLSMWDVLDHNNSMAVNFTAFRMFRVFRLLRILKTSKELQLLLKTLYQAMPNILNVLVLFALIVFVFTIAGMDLFGEYIIDQDVHFQTFYSGMMVLFRASTGESWNHIMHSYEEETKKVAMVRIYWLTYTLICFFIYINVLIAVIFYEFEQANEDQTGASINCPQLQSTDVD